ncbi:hypothetical protein GIB67_015335 [Kingdonia uniflora]|uniref:Fatty acid hydroxylase domain-containing protein n=1 Tax=Kingdonia uniflora TaxID=39325 RepID=A0A7J7KYV2_9MAGN|nr:hypothetical protein GIB67_015335 [Kingdonia uniflora]
MVAPLSTWPLENLGNFKYLLYGPLVPKVLYSRRANEVLPQQDVWCLHLLIICALRSAIYTACTNHSNAHYLTLKRRILPQGVGFKQIDSEWHWDNFIILQAFMACWSFPFLVDLPLWNSKGVLYALTFHVGISEPLYYWVHRYLHSDYFFSNYHSLHHSSSATVCHCSNMLQMTPQLSEPLDQDLVFLQNELSLWDRK